MWRSTTLIGKKLQLASSANSWPELAHVRAISCWLQRTLQLLRNLAGNAFSFTYTVSLTRHTAMVDFGLFF